MKCKKCGKEFDGGIFCPNCGTKYEQAKATKKQAGNGISLPIIIGASAAALAIIIGAAVFSSSRKPSDAASDSNASAIEEVSVESTAEESAPAAERVTVEGDGIVSNALKSAVTVDEALEMYREVAESIVDDHTEYRWLLLDDDEIPELLISIGVRSEYIRGYLYYIDDNGEVQYYIWTHNIKNRLPYTYIKHKNTLLWEGSNSSIPSPGESISLYFKDFHDKWKGGSWAHYCFYSINNNGEYSIVGSVFVNYIDDEEGDDQFFLDKQSSTLDACVNYLNSMGTVYLPESYSSFDKACEGFLAGTYDYVYELKVVNGSIFYKPDTPD